VPFRDCALYRGANGVWAVGYKEWAEDGESAGWLALEGHSQDATADRLAGSKKQEWVELDKKGKWQPAPKISLAVATDDGDSNRKKQLEELGTAVGNKDHVCIEGVSAFQNGCNGIYTLQRDTDSGNNPVLVNGAASYHHAVPFRDRALYRGADGVWYVGLKAEAEDGEGGGCLSLAGHSQDSTLRPRWEDVNSKKWKEVNIDHEWHAAPKIRLKPSSSKALTDYVNLDQQRAMAEECPSFVIKGAGTVDSDAKDINGEYHRMEGPANGWPR
jgi:hypothetical protein